MTTISLIYMASGRGKRFGSNKLLTCLDDKPLYQYGLDTLHAISKVHAWSLLVVTAYTEIAAWCHEKQIRVIINDQADEGMAASLRLGVMHTPHANTWAFFPADQPLLRPYSIEAFLDGFEKSPYTVGAMNNGIRPMSPAVFANQHKAELLAQQGDTGGRQILKKYNGHIYLYHPNPDELLDIDTLEDRKICLSKMRKR